MCGRYQLKMTWHKLSRLYRIVPSPEPEGPSLPLFNIAPTQAVPVLRWEGERELVKMRWGFPATWLARTGKDPWSRPLGNARAEDALTKATWKKALLGRRCVVPATGIYEWIRQGKVRLPVRLWQPSEAPMHLAAVWERFSRDGAPVDAVSILTTAASPDMAPIHDRMPVLIADEALDQWLSPSLSAEALASTLSAPPVGTLTRAPASRAVNRWQSQGPDLEQADWNPVLEGLADRF